MLKVEGCFNYICGFSHFVDCAVCRNQCYLSYSGYSCRTKVKHFGLQRSERGRSR